MSASTIFIKTPPKYSQSLSQVRDKLRIYSPVLSLVLWGISAICSASKASFSTNTTGLTLAFAIPDVVLIGVATFMLKRGMNNKRILLMVPWILLTCGSIYFNHLKVLLNMQVLLKQLKKLTWLPWSLLAVNAVLLIVRLTLVVRVLQLCAHWFIIGKLEQMKPKRSKDLVQ